jgi:methionine aminopeptidase
MINMGLGSGRSTTTVTVRTRDRLPSVHFEHTIAIHDEGPEILTCIKKK